MKIVSYVELTPAQERSIEGMQDCAVRTALVSPLVVATFTTFLAQKVKLTIDANGVIQHVGLEG